MNGFRYDTFENHAEIDEMVKKNKEKAIDYMSIPDQWDLPQSRIFQPIKK